MEIQQRLNKLKNLTFVNWIFGVLFFLFTLTVIVVAQIIARADAKNVNEAFSNFEGAVTFLTVTIILGIPAWVIPFVLGIVVAVKFSNFPESLKQQIKQQHKNIFVFLLLGIAISFIFHGLAFFAFKKFKVDKISEA